MTPRSELGRVGGNGSAKHGAGHWLAQRVTGLALVALGLWFLIALLLIPRYDYATLARWMNHGWNVVLLIVLVLVAAHHSYLGVRAISEDYVHPPSTRFVTLRTLQFAHVLVAAAGVFAILEVALGSTPLRDSV